MKKQIDFKAEKGKLLRIDAEIENSLIKEICITGDFFIHPETGIEEIEKSLKGKKVSETEKTVLELIEKKGIQLIGFTPKDLENALKKTLNGK